MTAQVSHIDEKTRGIVSTLAQRVDELAHDVASAVRAEVDFYKSTGAVADDDLLAGCTEPRRGRQALFSLTMSLILRRFVADRKSVLPDVPCARYHDGVVGRCHSRTHSPNRAAFPLTIWIDGQTDSSTADGLRCQPVAGWISNASRNLPI